jgi:hypothetical protein
MTSLGPHKLVFTFDEDETEDVLVTMNHLGPHLVDLGNGEEPVGEEGEVVIAFDDEEVKLKISAANTLSLIGTGIMMAESYIRGLANREGFSVHQFLPGDCDEPGNMFR